MGSSWLWKIQTTPDRTFPTNLYERDAELLDEDTWLQRILHHCGHCEGGVCALFLASKYPEKIERNILSAAFTNVLPYEVEIACS